MTGARRRKAPSSREASELWSRAGPLQTIARAGRFSVMSRPSPWICRSLGRNRLSNSSGTSDRPADSSRWVYSTCWVLTERPRRGHEPVRISSTRTPEGSGPRSLTPLEPEPHRQVFILELHLGAVRASASSATTEPLLLRLAFAKPPESRSGVAQSRKRREIR